MPQDSRFAAAPTITTAPAIAGFRPKANANGPVAAPVAVEIARYIREADLKSPAVIGHSMGGSIAIMLAARNPQLVGRLMVVDTMPFMGSMFGPPGTTAEGVRAIADQIRTRLLSEVLGSPDGMLQRDDRGDDALRCGARDPAEVRTR